MPVPGFIPCINGIPVLPSQSTVRVPGGNVILDRPPQANGTYVPGSTVSMELQTDDPTSQTNWSGVISQQITEASVVMTGERFVFANIVPPAVAVPTTVPTPIGGSGPSPTPPPGTTPTPTPTSAPSSPGSQVLYGVNSIDDGLSIINTVTGAVSFVGALHADPNKYVTPIALAVRPSDGTIFVWNNSDTGVGTGVLLTVDRCTGLATEVNPSTPPQGGMNALAFAPGGTLYGGLLSSVDTTTGTATSIGSPALPVGAASFNASGTLYGVELTIPSKSARLLTIDTATVSATLIATLSQSIGTVGDIVHDESGALIGSGSGGSMGNILFDINPNDGTVTNTRSLSGNAPQGLGFAPACGN